MRLDEPGPPEDEEQSEQRHRYRDPPGQRPGQTVGVAAILDEIVERRPHGDHDAEEDDDDDCLAEHPEALATMPGSIVERRRRAAGAPAGGWRFRPTLWPTLATLALLPLLVWLGLWQLERAEHKQALATRAEAQDARAPARLGAGVPEADSRPESWIQRRVTASGRYLPRHFLLDNRTRRGVVGYHVLSPFVLDEEGSPGVVVNRGWIPLGSSREVLPEIETPGGALALRGRSRVPGEAFLLGESGYRGDTWPRVVQSIDLRKMEEALGVDLLPFVVELDRAEPHGFEREWRPYGGIGPARHRAYAFQWFALAATLVVLYAILNLRRR